MKKFILLFAVLVCSNFALAAGTPQDMLYLKNGRVFCCTIIEQPDSSIVKIMTNDGSTFIFDMLDVQKIEKGMSASVPNFRERKSVPIGGNRLSKGYRGFVDIDNGGEFAEGYTFEFSTSHGYQFNPYLYLGGGLTLRYLGKGKTDEGFLPIYADVRVTIPTDIFVSPYIDVRGGYCVALDYGAYISTSIGGHFHLVKKIGANIGIAYSYQQEFDVGHFVSLRLGLDF